MIPDKTTFTQNNTTVVCLVIIGLVLAGCSTGTATSENKPLPTQTATLPAIIRVEPTTTSNVIPTATPDNKCQPQKIPVPGENIIDYRWSMDSQRIYFTSDHKEEIWSAFSLSTGAVETVKIGALEWLDKITSEVRNLYAKHNQQTKTEWDHIFFAPSGSSAIYLKIVSANEGSTVELTCGRDWFQDIYVLKPGKSAPKFVTRVEGLVTKVYWTQDEEKAILGMEEVMACAQLSPDHVWVVSLKDMSVTPMFKREDQSILGLLGTTSDGSWLVYKYYGRDKKLWARNLEKDQEVELPFTYGVNYIFPYDEDKVFVVLPDENEQQDQIELYDLVLRKSTVIKHFEIQYSRFSPEALKLSPNRRLLLYNSYNEKKFFVVNLCY